MDKKEFELLLAQKELLYKEINKINEKLASYDDGHIYLTKLRCYGSIRWELHTNEYQALELMDEYYGDNGIVDVYTTSNEFAFTYQHHDCLGFNGIEVVDEQELLETAENSNNTSMSQAIVQWMARGA
jgi:hypothetical protein